MTFPLRSHVIDGAFEFLIPGFKNPDFFHRHPVYDRREVYGSRVLSRPRNGFLITIVQDVLIREFSFFPNIRPANIIISRLFFTDVLGPAKRESNVDNARENYGTQLTDS